MKIVSNTSAFDGRCLRKIFRKAIEATGASQNLVFKVRGSSHERIVSGHGYYPGGCNYRDGHHVLLDIPKGASVAELGRVLEHEIAHTLGLRHGEMSPQIRACHGDWIPTWIEGLTLTPKSAIMNRAAADPSVRVDKRRSRYSAMVAKHSKAVKRHTTLLKKWQTRLKRLEAYQSRKGKATDSESLGRASNEDGSKVAQSPADSPAA